MMMARLSSKQDHISQRGTVGLQVVPRKRKPRAKIPSRYRRFPSLGRRTDGAKLHVEAVPCSMELPLLLSRPTCDEKTFIV